MVAAGADLPWPTEYATYSTPRDLMLLATAAMKYASFRQIVTPIPQSASRRPSAC